jgi:LmbE family N-acetylglucosaminyl deacetylase
MTREDGKTRLHPPILVLSPHFDDAVLSCGQFLSVHPGTEVMTVMGGSPESWDVFRSWDNVDCGLPLGTDVVGIRKKEDQEALSMLGCRYRWSDVRDIQYCAHSELVGRTEQVREAIERGLAECTPAACLMPLGTRHPDHKEVRRLALLAARADHTACRWFVYEELPYRPRFPSAYEEALGEIRAAGWTLKRVPLELDGDSVKKRSAVHCYRSQLGALADGDRGLDQDLEPEGYWELSLASERPPLPR